MDLRFYDYEFHLKKIVPSYISANWTLYYNDVGTAEFHFSPTDSAVEVILENDYLVVTQGDLQAIVTGKRVAEDDVAVYGRTMNWILTRRVIPKFKTTQLLEEGIITRCDAAQITQYVVNTAFSDVNLITCEDSPPAFDEMEPFWRNVTNAASDVIRECLEENGAGHRVVYDLEKQVWRYEILLGQSKNLILSESLKNAYETRYDEDCQDYYSAGWYEVEKEGEEGGEPETEWIRLEKDTDKEGIYLWEGKLSGSCESEAKADLKKKKWMREGSAGALSMRCGVDYQLGDSATIQLSVGDRRISTTERIIGVQIWNDEEGSGERPIFEEE